MSLPLAVLGLALVGLARPAHADWNVGAAVTAGVRPATSGLGALGQLTASYRASDRWALVLGAGAGAYDRPLDVVVQLRLDARWFPLADPAATLEPFAEAGFVHAHEIAWDAYTNAPLTATAGTCDCIHHRTGASVGGGLVWHLPLPVPLSLVARASAFALLPHGTQPNHAVEGGLGAVWTL